MTVLICVTALLKINILEYMYAKIENAILPVEPGVVLVL
jgi:hypothetical protein